MTALPVHQLEGSSRERVVLSNVYQVTAAPAPDV